MSVPAKGKYLSRHELPRAVVQFGRPEIRGPKDLMSMAHTILVSATFSSSLHLPSHTQHSQAKY